MTRPTRFAQPALVCLFLLALLPVPAAAQTAAEPPEPRPLSEVLAASAPADWRPLDPESTLYLELASGRVVIELAPAFAPRHVANVKTLARAGYLEGLAIVRSQDNYVVQWGDPAQESGERRSLGEAASSLPAELDRPLADELVFTPLPDGDVYAPEVGFSHGFPVARDPGTGRVWLAHCYGMVGAGREAAAHSGSGAELYVVIGHAPRHLDRNVTLLGRVVQGMEHLSTLPRGTGALGFYEDPAEQVPLKALRLAADLPPEERGELEILRTDTATFRAVIAARRHRGEEWFLHPVDRIELCNVPVPVRRPPAGAGEGDAACPEQSERLAAIAAALERRPEDATLHFFQALTYARCGDADRAAEALRRTASHGDGFLPAADLGFEGIQEDPAFQAAYAEMEAALPQVADAQVAWRIEGRDLIPEGIAHDPATGRLFLGSLARRQIVVVDAEGRQTVFAGPEDGLGQILGLAVDGERGRLLAVDAGTSLGEEEAGRPDAVVVLDLDSGRVLGRLEAPGAGQLNDVTVAPDGTVFATDSRQGGVWRAAPGAPALERWPPEVPIPGANGLAVSAGGDALFVAHSTGIARIEIPGGEVTPRIGNATRETLAAIDGLYRRGQTLIGVQNVTNPGRVIEIQLDEAGRRALAVRTLLSHHHPALAEPTTGAVDGDRFLLLADSFVARLQPDGSLRDPESLRDPVILAVPLEPLP